jgi:hypothetical protein
MQRIIIIIYAELTPQFASKNLLDDTLKALGVRIVSLVNFLLTVYTTKW